MSHATQLHDRGYLADYMQIMRRCSLPGNVQDEVYRQVHARALETVKWTLKHALDEEVRTYLGRARYERDIVPHHPEETRSGAYGPGVMDAVWAYCQSPCAQTASGAIAVCSGRR